MLTSGVKQSDSDLYVYVSVFRLFSIIGYIFSVYTEYSTLCYTVGPCRLSILYTVVKVKVA